MWFKKKQKKELRCKKQFKVIKILLNNGTSREITDVSESFLLRGHIYRTFKSFYYGTNGVHYKQNEINVFIPYTEIKEVIEFEPKEFDEDHIHLEE